MKFTQFIATAALAALANAHARVWSISVNDVSQGNSVESGGYIRSPPNNSPLKDLTSTDLRCNVGGGSAQPKTITVAAGSKITVQWYHDSDSASDDIIDGSHKGPVLVYIAPTSSNGAGNVWVKLAEEGYSGGKWAVDNLKTNGGKHSFVLPAALANGEYIIRPEIIAHHESDTTYNVNPARGAQLYMSCIQIKVTSGGGTELPTGVAIPGVYTYTDPGILFNLYGSFTSYPIPGPAVWKPVSGGSPATTLKTTTKATVPTTTSKAPVVVPTTTKAPVVVTTTTKAPVVVPTTTKAPVVVPTTTKAPVVVPTTTKAPVVVPTTTKAVVTTAKPVVTSSKAACPAPTTKLITVVKPAPTGGPTVGKYEKCGGIGYNGPKICAAGSTCKEQNPWYSQCL